MKKRMAWAIVDKRDDELEADGDGQCYIFDGIGRPVKLLGMSAMPECFEIIRVTITEHKPAKSRGRAKRGRK